MPPNMPLVNQLDKQKQNQDFASSWLHPSKKKIIFFIKNNFF
jgi:hypothetical protein